MSRLQGMSSFVYKHDRAQSGTTHSGSVYSAS